MNNKEVTFMKILAIGDIVGKNGCEFLKNKLPILKKRENIDLVIANGENSAEGNGITPESAKFIFSSEADIITTGNHVFKRKEIRDFLGKHPSIIRPANYPPKTTPGKGFCIAQVRNIKIAIINLMGIVYLENLRCPFETIDDILKELSECTIKIVDFHAEATAEKRALGFYLDGKISAMFGTHTHVQTSDETILPFGTGYITDVGMTGVIDSILGVKKDIIIKRHIEKLPMRFENASGECKMECVLFDIDEITGLTNNMQRLRITNNFNL
jgi:metallophosphoesterase (TIGR00282 family)